MTGVGVAISTHRRPQVLAQALQHWAGAMPDVLVVNHDIRGDGVAVTKNRGIAALMDAGCEHLFLADDDVWPVHALWWKPYLSDPEPHLMHCWGKSRAQGRCGCSPSHTLWSWPRGVLLYAHRSVIDSVGGMRTEFGRWGGEHAEWTTRIHNAGLTRHRFADAAGISRGIWHCEDYTRNTPSTVSDVERRNSAARRHALYDQFRGSTDFVDYRS